MAQQDDALALLDADHIRVERLFTQYKTAADSGRKRILAHEICHELTLHTQLEEEIFYPAFRQATGDDQLVQHSEQEHQHAKELVAKVEADQTNAKLMLELEDAVLHHVNDEREKMFPAARKAKGMDLMRLARQLELRRSELLVANPV